MSNIHHIQFKFTEAWIIGHSDQNIGHRDLPLFCSFAKGFAGCQVQDEYQIGMRCLITRLILIDFPNYEFVHFVFLGSQVKILM